jgi:hypothetical protein
VGKPTGGERGEPTYVERPDVSETLVDALESLMYDGNSLRMEFVVHRFAPPQDNGKANNKKVTAVRLVIPLGGAINLASQLNAMIGALEQQGAIGEVRFVQSKEGLN